MSTDKHVSKQSPKRAARKSEDAMARWHAVDMANAMIRGTGVVAGLLVAGAFSIAARRAHNDLINRRSRRIGKGPGSSGHG